MGGTKMFPCTITTGGGATGFLAAKRAVKGFRILVFFSTGLSSLTTSFTCALSVLSSTMRIILETRLMLCLSSMIAPNTLRWACYCSKAEQEQKNRKKENNRN